MRQDRKYRAFISYSHSDSRHARRIFRKLSTYRIPSAVARGQARKLGEFFMDREALPAAKDLSAEIVSALANAEAMIVVCSEAAARSSWVAREISTFRSLHPEAPILAAIAPSDASGTGSAATCFPDGLLEDGEPLAADFNKEGDGAQLAYLKLVSGLTRIPLEDLSRRDQRRRNRRVTAITAGSALIALVMSALAVAAVSASQLAQRKQAEAEGMVDFMLGDLRDRLEPVGRLDALSGVAQKALDYYSDEDEQLGCDALGRKAKALQLATRVAIDTGDRQAAFGYADLSNDLADRLARTCAGAPETLFTVAQAEYWAGEALRRQWRSGDAASDAPELKLVRAHWQAYFDLSRKLHQLAPDNDTYRLELAFARSNLGTINLNMGDAQKALDWFRLAEADFREIAEANPENVALQLEYADAISWTSTALNSLSRLDESLDLRRRHKDMLVRLDRSMENPDWRVRRHIVTAHLRMIETLIAKQDSAAAEAAIIETRPLIEQLRVHDPENSDWQDAEVFLAGHEHDLRQLTRSDTQP